MIFQNLVIMNLFTFCSSVDSAVLNRVQQVTCLNQQRRGFQQRSFYTTGSYQQVTGLNQQRRGFQQRSFYTTGRYKQVTCLNQQRRGFQQHSFYLIGSYNEEEEICVMYFEPLFFA
jgi:hypothetical protein